MKKINTIQTRLPHIHESKRILGESARINVTLPLARSTLQGSWDHVWCPLSLLWGPEFPLITPQLLDEVMPAVVPRITVRPPNTQLLNHVKRALWWVGRCPWNVTTSWISSLSFASVWIGCQKDKQKSPVHMYNDKFSLLSTYCVPDTTMNTLYVLSCTSLTTAHFTSEGREAPTAYPRSPAIKWKN